MGLFHGVQEQTRQSIEETGLKPTTDTDTVTTILDESRPDQFPERADSVFFSPTIEPVDGYKLVVTVETRHLPTDIPCYIGNRRITDEIEFTASVTEWGRDFGDPTESAHKYWEHARVVDGDIPQTIGPDTEVVFKSPLPPTAITDIRPGGHHWENNCGNC